MTLTDGDVAVLADQAAGLIPSSAEVRIAPAAADDPYRWGAQSWTVYFDVGPNRDDTIAVWVAGDESPISALHRLVDGLGELSETTRYWGAALPHCLSGHRHPARADVAGPDVVLRCPDTDEIVARLRPALP